MLNLPLEITDEIINILSQDDPSLSSTWACALVCHRFHHLCRKHIFASMALNYRYAQPPPPFRGITKTTTPKLRKLLDTSPEIANYVRNLTYSISSDDFEDDSLVQTLRKLTGLKYLFVLCGKCKHQWNNNPLRPGLLHLLHLPTLVYFRLFNVSGFIVSDLEPCVNLKHFEFDHLTVLDADEIITSNVPKTSIKLRNISVGVKSAIAVTKLCAARRADGKSFIDFNCLSKLSVQIWRQEDFQVSLDLFSRCRQLTSVEMNIADVVSRGETVDLTELGVFNMLNPSMQTLKHLYVYIGVDFEDTRSADPLCGLCNGLEEMRNENVIKTITINIRIQMDSDCGRGDDWGRLDTVLTQSGWPKLRCVSLAIEVCSFSRRDGELERALGKLPATQFPKLTSSTSLSFEFSVRGVLV